LVVKTALAEMLLGASSAFIQELESIRGSHALGSGLLDARSCDKGKENGCQYCVHKLTRFTSQYRFHGL
jgi:hypothetical protein